MRAIYAAQGPAGGLDRHKLRERLHPPRPTPGVETLIVAFEGTGAFEPRLAPMVMRAYRDLGSPAVPDGDDLVKAALGEIARAEGRETKWSALMAGPLPALLEAPALTGGFDWASFPSEESDLLVGLDGITKENLGRLDEDIRRSRAGLPTGVVDATAWVRSYLAAWPEGTRPPRLVVLAHSSGTRSAVKTLEELKGPTKAHPRGVRIEADLAFSIDPVRAAHEALKELLPQMLGQGAHYNVRKVPAFDWLLDRVGAPDPVLPRVWHRDHPDHLYKPGNVKRWVSVFQLDDTLGMKLPPHHGIQGSTLRGADHEEHVRGLGDDGHGAIGYHERTLELWREELQTLRRRQ
jgi:hypothetical protein